MGDWILHVDLDQFLAAVEVLRRTELAGRPVVVGGDGNPNRPRQVVATASYEARAFGVRSGMPLGMALRKCPDAVFLPSDRPAYDAASEQVMATLRSFGVEVEVWGWDEAVLGASTDDPEALAQEIKARVLAETKLTCAVGIGETKLQAKTATGFAKPGGIARGQRPCRRRRAGSTSDDVCGREADDPSQRQWRHQEREGRHGDEDRPEELGPAVEGRAEGLHDTEEAEDGAEHAGLQGGEAVAEAGFLFTCLLQPELRELLGLRRSLLGGGEVAELLLDGLVEPVRQLGVATE